MSVIFNKEKQDSPTEAKDTLVRRLSRFGHTLCVKHDFLSSGKIKGETRNIRKYYDFWAPFYDLVYPRSKAYVKSGDFIVDNFVSSGDYVLDLGAGTGLLTIPMLNKAISVISYDLHPKMLERGRRKAHKKMVKVEEPVAGLSFCQGDAIDLPFSCQSFDLITSAFMFVYLNKQQKINSLKECRRVLTKDGRLALLTSQGEIHSRFLCREDWIEIFTTAGFEEPDFNDFSDVFRSIHAEVSIG